MIVTQVSIQSEGKTSKAPHKCLAVLGNQLRVDILHLLKESPSTVTSLCSKLNKEQSLVSHSLHSLRNCSFVDYRNRGKERIYFLKSDLLLSAQNLPLLEAIEAHAKKYCSGKCGI